MSPTTVEGPLGPPTKQEYPGLDQQILVNINPVNHPYLPTPESGCNTPDSNDLFWVHVPANANNPGNAAMADFLVYLPNYYRFFFVASRDITVAGDTLYFHLRKLNKSYGVSTAINPDGTEEWFPLHNFTNSGGAGLSNLGVGTWLSFCRPISKFYLDIGCEHGGTGIGAITIVCTNDLDFVRP